MSYASEADIDRLYPGKLDLLATVVTEDEEARDTARIAQALADATAEIDSYVAVRYPLPLSAVPDVLVNRAVDLAVYRLAATADVLTDEVVERAKEARAWLRDLAAGKAALNLPRTAPEAIAPDLVEVDAPPRRFPRTGRL